MKKNDYQRCTRCIMDNASDNSITFDEQGICNYCKYAYERKDSTYFPNYIGKKKLNDLVNSIKKNGVGKSHDCIMGLSGGLDSSYLAYLGYKMGLRILAFHIDDGFNTKIATENIQNLCSKCNIDLIIEKPDEEQFIDVTKSMFFAGLSGICNPQDNIITSYLYKNSIKYNIRTFLSGSNFSLESVLQRGDGSNASDGYHIKQVAKKYGTKGFDKLELISIFYSYILTKYRYKLKMYKPLDYIDYNKDKAIKELNDFCGFNYYGGKHYENILTYFSQVYYLPKKFNIDKRKSHLSSLVVSSQLSRDEAIQELEKPLYDEKFIEEVIELVIKKFDISKKKFDEVMAQRPNLHSDYPQSPFARLERIARYLRKYLND